MIQSCKINNNLQVSEIMLGYFSLMTPRWQQSVG